MSENGDFSTWALAASMKLVLSPQTALRYVSAGSSLLLFVTGAGEAGRAESARRDPNACAVFVAPGGGVEGVDVHVESRVGADFPGVVGGVKPNPLDELGPPKPANVPNLLGDVCDNSKLPVVHRHNDPRTSGAFGFGEDAGEGEPIPLILFGIPLILRKCQSQYLNTLEALTDERRGWPHPLSSYHAQLPHHHHPRKMRTRTGGLRQPTYNFLVVFGKLPFSSSFRHDATRQERVAKSVSTPR